MIFGACFGELAGLSTSPATIAVITLAILTAVNWLGAPARGRVQNGPMLTKIVAIHTRRWSSRSPSDSLP